MQRIPTPVCGTDHIDAEHEAFIQKNIPSEDMAADAAALFSQLSDSTRIRLLSMLALGDMCVCEMAHVLGMSQPAVSHHLRSLRQSGVVRYKKSGKRAVYFLNPNETGNIVRHVLKDICETMEVQNEQPQQ